MAASSLRNRSAVAVLSVFTLGFVYWAFFRSGADSSVEQINDILQNKNEDISIKKVELAEQSLHAPFVDKHTLKSANWVLAGDIIVENDKHISLTTDSKHQTGNMFAKAPIRAESFEMELTFHVHGEGGINADGMAVWLIDKPSPIGDVFGAQNDFTGMGIFFDTFRNGRHGNFPYVSAQMATDGGPLHYDKYLDGMNTKLDGCTARSLLNPLSKKSRMRIVHTKNGYFSVDFNYDPDYSGVWHNCFTLNDIHLPKEVYLGVSAETGELSESVEIINNKVFAMFTPDGTSYIHSIEQVEDILEKNIESEERKGAKQGRRRKALARMRGQEKRVEAQARERRQQLYGDPDLTFVRRTLKRVKMLFTWVLFALLAAVLAWVARLVLKSRKSRGRRSYGAGGLLS